MSGYYNVPGQPHLGDRRTHECGCVTHFDVAQWCVVRETICAEHQQKIARLPHYLPPTSRPLSRTGNDT